MRRDPERADGRARTAGTVTATAAAATLVLLATVACGAATGAADTSVDIGYFPLVHTAPVVHADETGLFAEAGLDVELHTTAGGAQAIPSLVAGEYDIVYTNYVSAVTAAEQGLPVVVVAGNDVGADDHAVMVTADSPLSEPADLEGATVGVNSLQNVGSLAMSAVLEDTGADPALVDFVELPYPVMGEGEIDAMWQVEPFATGALADGHEVLFPPVSRHRPRALREGWGLPPSTESLRLQLFPLFDGPTADLPVAGWVTTREYAAENPETVRAFRDALSASVDQVRDDRDLLVDLVPTYTEVSAEVVSEVAMPVWNAAPDPEGLAATAGLMERFGLIGAPFDTADMISAP
jgi:NitT/TauT family transport system substrate-binding protein